MHRIIELMEERGLKQSEIMKVCNVGQSTISMWKKGATPNVQTLMILADYFQVSIDYLLGREDDYGNITTADIYAHESPEFLKKAVSIVEDQRRKGPEKSH